MHYSCRNKSNRSERLILKVTDGYQAQVSESICFSLETAVGLTAEYAEYAERRGRQNEVLKMPSVRSERILRNGFFFRMFRVFCGSFAAMIAKFSWICDLL